MCVRVCVCGGGDGENENTNKSKSKSKSKSKRTKSRWSGENTNREERRRACKQHLRMLLCTRGAYASRRTDSALCARGTACLKTHRIDSELWVAEHRLHVGAFEFPAHNRSMKTTVSAFRAVCG